MAANSGIQSFTDLYTKATAADSFISDFIIGHLMVEFLLLKIIEIHSPKLVKLSENLNHYRIVQLAHGLGLISDDQQTALLAINKMRNKLAHDIAFRPSVSDFKALLKIAQIAFTDLTDGISQGLEEIEGKASLDDCESYIFPELFIQVSYDLHHIYHDLGGDIEEF